MEPNAESPDLRPLPGSERRAAHHVGGPSVDPATAVDVTLVLRRPDEGAAGTAAAGDDVALVRRVLTDRGITVTEVHEQSRRVTAAGPVEALTAAFGTRLEEVTADGRSYRQRTGGLSVPAELDGVVVAVLGLDDRPQARAHHRVVPAAAVKTSYTPLQLGRTYRFPAGTDGSGTTLAIIELGGGYDDADLRTYFGSLGQPVPAVRAVGVDGARNAPEGDPGGADGEVLLDIEVAGALAPGAAIVVYFAPNTDRGFLDAVATAAHASPTPAAISISWGQSEDEWTAQARRAMDDAFADACALGVTVTAAAGDDGSTDRATDGRSHVDFPAASPHVLACGGTALHADPGTGQVRSETVWNNPGHGATGGGVSDTFSRPRWQREVGVPPRAGGAVAVEVAARAGRGVPDVAGDADPATGYDVLVDGRRQVIGGTSAVAPLWAALVCRLVQGLGRPLGLLQPQLYAGVTAGHPAEGLRDITDGDNGAYAAGPGWDACTGLGVPDGTALLARLRAAAAPPAPPAPGAPAPGQPAPGAPAPGAPGLADPEPDEWS